MSNTPTIDTERLRRLLSAGEPVTVLDVRPPDQRAEWSIPGSIHVDAYDQLQSGDAGALRDVDPPRDGPVVVVCEAGRTSEVGAEFLRRTGHDAMSLRGGMRAWSMAWNTAELVLSDDVRVVQVRRTGKGCLSYVVTSGGEALVIDASLPPEVYLGIAAVGRDRIVGVVDTHVHADHLSRGKALAEAAEAPWYVPAQDRIACTFVPLRSGQGIPFGRSRLEAIHTPGHTWESSSYLVAGAVFTGDTLFTDGVGRPDLEADPAEARRRAAVLHASLQRLLTLPGDALVLPGHTSEPVQFDGVPWTSTLADVERDVALLRHDRERFVERITHDLPAPPPNHVRIVQCNEDCELPEDLVQLEAGANRCAIR